MNSAGSPEVTVFCLHYLGGSAREWAGVASTFESSIRMVAIDLPGFGDASLTPGFSVESMATYVAGVIRRTQPQRWLLVGHSMGAKVATVLATWHRDGTLDVDGLVGLVLLAGSPPSPEPMSDDKRERMTHWFRGDQSKTLAEARGYVADNTGAPLDSSSELLAVNDVLQASPAAWVAWLQEGSKEDWATRVGVLKLPVLIVTGSADAGLGREAQRKYMAPHFSDVQLVELPAAGHLLPLERPGDIARLIAEHSARCVTARPVNEDARQRYEDLIMSSRVGEGTREALTKRRSWQPTGAAMALTDAQRSVLGSMLERVIPQRACCIDLASRLDEQLASGEVDGWRFAALPPDRTAYRLGLDTLDAAAHKMFRKGFVDLNAGEQGQLLQRAADGMLAVISQSSDSALLDAAQMKKWFEEVRGHATRIYMLHPNTLARVGYSGIANGGDGQPKSGFVRIGIAATEAWEPEPLKCPP